MLGRSVRESPAHAALAAEQGRWYQRVEVAAGSTNSNAAADVVTVPTTLPPWATSAPGAPGTVGGELLDLGSGSSTLATVAAISDLAAVVHLGHPEQPEPALEESLLAGDESLMLTAAQAVLPEWTWAGRPDATGGTVVIDEPGLRDCNEVLRTLGVSPRLVPAHTSVERRVEIAGRDGSLVIERSRLPKGFVELPGSERLSELPPIWYGLLEARPHRPEFDYEAQVWLAFGPYTDHRGSLQPTLAVFADAGIDLAHLRSHPSVAGPHVFFTSFNCPDASVLDSLIASLDARGIAHRTLAVLAGIGFLPGPKALAPCWDARPIVEGVVA